MVKEIPAEAAAEAHMGSTGAAGGAIVGTHRYPEEPDALTPKRECDLLEVVDVPAPELLE